MCRKIYVDTCASIQSQKLFFSYATVLRLKMPFFCPLMNGDTTDRMKGGFLYDLFKVKADEKGFLL
jgi:methionine salvage enolase-phosphatase E1